MVMTVEQQKVFQKFTTKPSWMKNAILTKRGWTNPETGELLLGRRTPEWVFAELDKLGTSPEKKDELVEVHAIEPTQVEVVEEPVVQVAEEAVVAKEEPKVEEELDLSEFTENRPKKAAPRGRRPKVAKQ